MKNLFTFLLILVSGYAFAQKTITGTVTDEEGETLPYAAVVVKGTSTGTVTDDNGKFTLKVPEGATTLVVSYTGLETVEVEINGQSTIDVKMGESSLDLDPVVVSASKRKEKLLEAPAAIDVIDAKEIQVNVSTSPTDYVKDVAGVDVMKTGIAQSNVVTRGFNNIFSGSVLTMIDYRIGSVPSLRVNVNQLMPGNYLDIERVEVLKGPASALYGPNAASGAIHILTKSPLDEKKDYNTTVTLGGGERSTFIAQFRHTGKVKKSTESSPLAIGYRISGQYLQAHDWTYDDPEEPDSIVFGKQTPDGRIPLYEDGTEVPDSLIAQGINGDTVVNNRNNFLQNYNIDGRLDIRINSNTEVILSGGYSNASGIELTGLGAGQAVKWNYLYGQARFKWKDLFIQGYMNASDAGDTYLLRSGNLIIDKSKFYVGQIQHSYEKGKWRFIYGGDAQLTRPETEGTINGRNEDSDNIDIYGGYVQAEYKANDWLKLLAATRVDYSTAVEDPAVSPRAAAVIKPYPGHNVRLTYNRAFSSPSALTNSLDIMERQDPFGIGTLIPSITTGYDIRALGNGNGFNFNRNDQGVLQFRTPFAPLFNNATTADYFSLNDANYFDEMWTLLRILFAGSFTGDGLDPSAVQNVNSSLLTQLPDGVGTALIPLNLDKAGFFHDEAVNPDDIKDIAPVGNQITNTYEIGYNGLIAKRMVFKLDMYRSDVHDFVSPLLIQTPNVFLDQAELYAALNEIASNSSDPQLVADLLEFDKVENGGNGNGDGLEEVVGFLSGFPLGTISPEEANDPSVLLTYRNFGQITVYGFDVDVIYFLTEKIKLGATYSFVNKDEFETEGQIIALNAPRHKFNFTTTFNFEKIGLNVGMRWRWQDAFPANSGVYAGDVPALNQLDLNADYALPFSKQTHVSVTVQNVYDNQIREFVGVPTMGRLTLFRVSHTF